MKKNVLCVGFVGLLSLSLLTGCGSNDTASTDSGSINKVTADTLTDDVVIVQDAPVSDVTLVNAISERDELKYINMLGCNLVIPSGAIISASHEYQVDNVPTEDYYISNQTFENAVEANIISEEGVLVDKGVINRVSYSFNDGESSYNFEIETNEAEEDTIFASYDEQLEEIKSFSGDFTVFEKTDDSIRVKLSDDTYKILYKIGDTFVVTISYSGDLVEDMSIEQIMTTTRLK